MIRIKYLIIIFLAICLNGCIQNDSSFPNGIEHVIVIGIDAMSVDGLKAASTPNMDKLIANGALCNRVRTVQPSSSAANWGSMLAGAGTEIHGITSNDWRVDDPELQPVVVNENGFFPTILSVVRAQRPNDEIGMLYHWAGFGDLFEKGLASIDKSFKTEEETANAIADYIKTKRPTFVYSQFDDVDHIGHRYGHMSNEYLNSIAKVDTFVGIIVQAVKEAGIDDKTMIMVVSDHGGIGYGHGGTNTEEIYVPFILSGAGVKKNYSVTTDIYMFDVAPTIAFALSLEEPYCWRGKAIKGAFEGFETPTDPLLIKRFSKAPDINGGRHLFEQAGGLFIDESEAMVTISAEEPEGIIYYTTDGSTPTQSSTKYTNPFQVNKTTVVKAKTFTNGKESNIANGYFRFVNNNNKNGVKATFYQEKRWRGIPKFSELKPGKTWETYEIRIDKTIIDEIKDRRESSFGIVFTGKIEIDNDGEYTFYIQSDDGSCLYIDGNQIVNNDGDHGVIERRGNVNLTKGLHDIRVEFINAGGGYWVEAFYKGPGIPKQIIPPNKLFR